jgi:hypothetical protein
MAPVEPFARTSSAGRGQRLLLTFVLAGLVAPALLEAGYHGAFGLSDAEGRQIGFNHPILLSHLPVMARAITPAVLINAFLPWTLAAMVAQAFLTRLPFVPRRLIPVHAVAFFLLQVGGLLLLLNDGHHPSGECVVEGECSTAMALLMWGAAWAPAILSAFPWSRFAARFVPRGDSQ